MKRFIKRLVIVLVLLGGSLSVFPQIDTVFWFAVPKLTSQHAHTPISLVVSSFDDLATVTVTKGPNSTPIASFNVMPGRSQTYTLVNYNNGAELSGLECPHNQICDNGIYIHSTEKINAYVAVQQNNSEIYALKGGNGLGTRFFVATQFQFDNGNGISSSAYSQARNTVEIIATENNTTVTITPSVACVGHTAGTTFTVLLQRGQVYTLAANSQAAANHLCGTIITSDKPIVVDVSDDSVTPHCPETTDQGNGSADLVADQLVPEEMAGGKYIVVPSPSQLSNSASTSSGGNYYLDYAFVFALENNTNVAIYSGNTSSPTITNYTMNRGDKQKFHFGNDTPIFIDATRTDPSTGTVVEAPILVFQITGAGKEFGGTLLPYVDHCTGSLEVGYSPLQSAAVDDYGNPNPHPKTLYLTLLCNAAYTTGFEINGNSNIITASDWSSIPGDPTMKYCRKNVSSNFTPSPTTMNVFRVTNSLGNFHMGVFDINGSYDDCSIGYFSNYASESSIKFASNITFNDYCQGDTIFFGFDSMYASIQCIRGPNSYVISQPPYYRAAVQPADSGWYIVEATDSRGCVSGRIFDSIKIVVHPSPDSVLYDTICPGAGYSQNGFRIQASNTVNPRIIVDTLVLQTVGFGCDSLLILNLKIRDSICEELSREACNQYTWNGKTYTESGDITDTFQSTITGCDSLVTLHLKIEKPSVEIVASGDDFCESGELVLTALSDYQDYLWSTGETTPSITVIKPQTLYIVTVTKGACQASDEYETPDCPLNIFIPNAITPSKADNQNDHLCLPEYVHRFISDFDIEIYNRWGNLVFKSNDMNFRWYGNIDGSGNETRVHVSDVYVYIIRYERIGKQGEKYVKTGTVTVL